MIIKYKNKVVMMYNIYVYVFWEGYCCVFNGSKGCIEINVVEGGYFVGGEVVIKEGFGEFEKNYIQGGVEKIQIVVYFLWKEFYVVDVVKGYGGYGGGDLVLLEDVFVGGKDDKFKCVVGI